MTKMTTVEYERLKRFMGLYYEWFEAKPEHPPEIHPVRVLEEIESRAPAGARKGLAAAINDIVEDSSDWLPDRVAKANSRFEAADSPTLSEVRRSYSKKYLKCLERGAVRSIEEYYLLKGVEAGGSIEFGAEEREKVLQMLTEYENKIHRK